MKIAIMGTRGIPANYGGFETFAEYLSTGLVKRGHEVCVYCRSNRCKTPERMYRGVRLVVLPTLSHKYFDTVAHTALSVVHGLFQHYDAVLICNSVNSVFSFIPRLAGSRVAVNVDGLEWQRAKWNRLGQWTYRASEFLATFLPNLIVTDSMTIRRYYLRKFRKDSVFIPYGAETKPATSDEVLRRFGLEKDRYFLYVSRLEPENNAHRVIAAFEKVPTDMKLVIVGDAPYSSQYIQSLKRTTDTRIVFTGYVFGEGYREFRSHAYAYIQATEVGGTHPALLEAMGYGNCVLANDCPEHHEVLGDKGLFFTLTQVNDLTEKMIWLLKHPDAVADFRRGAQERIRQSYSWDHIVTDYERLFMRMSGKGIRA
jgi:glycosyltransferase involved in cell wall biosynthesis